VSISFTIGLLVSVTIGAAGFANFVIPFILRGSVIAAWGMGLVIIIAGFGANAVRKRATVKIISTFMAVSCLIQVFLILASGIDVTRTVFSPASFVGQFADILTHALTNSKHTPTALRGASSELMVKMLTRVGGSIAAVQAIGFLPFPYNMILFFIHYRFVTVLVVCIIPTIFAIWASYRAYSSRFPSKKATVHSSSDSSVRDLNESSDSESERRPLNREVPVKGKIVRQSTLEQQSNIIEIR
jgi:hypothetical protein